MSMFIGVEYFHGRLTAEESNFRLIRRGSQEGLYLIYEDREVAGKFILAVCFQNRIHNYYLGVSSEGQISYGDGVTAPLYHPHDLVHYHVHDIPEGTSFITKPLVPCLRPNENDDQPMAWPTVSMEELEIKMIDFAKKKNMTAVPLSEVLRQQRPFFLMSVAKELHLEQPWFHGSIEREEAERFLTEVHGKSGTFLIRERSVNDEYALSMVYKKGFRHYTIHRRRTKGEEEKFHLDDEPCFPNLMDIVVHYRNKPESYVLKLMEPCVCQDFIKRKVPKLESDAEKELRNYEDEVDSIQNPTDSQVSRTKLLSVEQQIEVVIGENGPHVIHPPKTTKKTDNFQECFKDEDDKILEEMISSVTSFNQDWIVTKIDFC